MLYPGSDTARVCNPGGPGPVRRGLRLNAGPVRISAPCGRTSTPPWIRHCEHGHVLDIARRQRLIGEPQVESLDGVVSSLREVLVQLKTLHHAAGAGERMVEFDSKREADEASWVSTTQADRRATNRSSSKIENRRHRPMWIGSSSSFQMSWYTEVRLMASSSAAPSMLTSNGRTGTSSMDVGVTSVDHGFECPDGCSPRFFILLIDAPNGSGRRRCVVFLYGQPLPHS